MLEAIVGGIMVGVCILLTTVILLHEGTEGFPPDRCPGAHSVALRGCSMGDLRFLFLLYIPAGLALIGILLCWWLYELWYDDDKN